MFKKIDPYVMSEKDEESMAVSNWAFDSHNWIEYFPGYYKCKWCDMSQTSAMPIDIHFPLCKENPSIKNMLQNIKDKIV